MAVDYSAYGSQSQEESQEEEAKAKSFSNNTFQKREYVNLENGVNVVRFFPAQLKSSTRKWAYAKIGNWLEVMVNKKPQGWK